MRDISKGYIALYRQFLEWEWFTDVKTCHLFQYCLLRANNKNTVWRGINIKRGQFVTSLRTMSIETGLSLQEVRTSLKKLTHELTQLASPSYSIITVVNYNLYQKTNTQINKRLTTDNNIISNTSYIKVSLSIGEQEILKKYLIKQKRKNPIEDIDAYISTLSKNGDLANKLQKAKQWQERQQRKEEEERKKREKKKSEAEIKNSPEEEEKIRQIQERIKKEVKNNDRRKSFDYKNQN